MIYLLDTSAAIAIIRGKPASSRLRLQQASEAGHELAISTISTYELWFGAARSPRAEESFNLVEAFLAGVVQTVSFDAQSALIAGELRASLEKRGERIGPYDLLIAAQALAIGATLVSGNMREFGRVEGLGLEDWSAE